MTPRECSRLMEMLELDPRLRLAPMAARAVWLLLARALLRMPEAGVGRVEGRPLGLREVGLLVGADAEAYEAVETQHETQKTYSETCAETKPETQGETQPKTRLETWIDGLVRAGLLGREEDGALRVDLPVSRDVRAATSRENGRFGGRPRRGETAREATARRQGNLMLPVRGDRAAETQGETQAAAAPRARATAAADSRQEAAAGVGEALEVMNRIVELAGMDPARGFFDAKPVSAWLAQGVARETILSVVEGMVARRGFKPPRTLGYFTEAVMEAHAAARVEPAPALSAEDRDWMREIGEWQANGCVGPAPARRRAAA